MDCFAARATTMDITGYEPSMLIALSTSRSVCAREQADEAIQCPFNWCFVKRATRGNDVRTQYRGACGATNLPVVELCERN